MLDNIKQKFPTLFRSRDLSYLERGEDKLQNEIFMWRQSDTLKSPCYCLYSFKYFIHIQEQFPYQGMPSVEFKDIDTSVSQGARHLQFK